MTTPWRQCDYCGKIVKINKPIFGSMHVCVSDFEAHAIDQFRYQQQMQSLDYMVREQKKQIKRAS